MIENHVSLKFVAFKSGCFGRENERECCELAFLKASKIVSETAYKKMSNIINGARRHKNSCPIKMLFLVCLTLQISLTNFRTSDLDYYS